MHCLTNCPKAIVDVPIVRIVASPGAAVAGPASDVGAGGGSAGFSPAMLFTSASVRFPNEPACYWADRSIDRRGGARSAYRGSGDVIVNIAGTGPHDLQIWSTNLVRVLRRTPTNRQLRSQRRPEPRLASKNRRRDSLRRYPPRPATTATGTRHRGGAATFCNPS